MKSKSRVFWDGLRNILVYAAAALTMLLLVGIIGYVLIQGLPQLSWSLISSVPSVIRDIEGILPYILNCVYSIILFVCRKKEKL